MSHSTSGAKHPLETLIMNRRTALRLAMTSAAGVAISRTGQRSVMAQDATPETAEESSAVVATVEGIVDQLNDYIESLMAETGLPGLAISIVTKDEIAFEQGYGVRSTETGEPVDSNSVFQLASVSKPIASTVVSALVGDGIVTWDDLVIEHLPDFALYDPWITANVTLRDMFSHRSGLPEHGGDLLENLGGDRELVLHQLRYLDHGGKFRETYDYTNFGLTAAAESAAHAAGSSWEDISASRLYEPLGMASTSSLFSDYEQAPERAYTHVPDAEGVWSPRYVRDPDAQSPAGGVSSTVHDMAACMRLQLNEGMLDGQQIVDSAALAQTHLPHIVSNEPEDPTLEQAGFYGLGWNVNYGTNGEVRIGHSGAFGLGAGTVVNLYPALGLGITVLTNGFPSGIAESVALTAFDLIETGAPRFDYYPILEQIFRGELDPGYGEDVAGDPDPELPLLDATAYVGNYGNDFFGPLEIAAEEDALSLSVGPAAMSFDLTPFTRDVFTYQPEGENAGGPSAVTFTIGADGQATQVMVEILDKHGEGTFTRTA